MSEFNGMHVTVRDVQWFIWTVGAENRQVVLAQPLESHGEWRTLDKTSPSGRQLFECEKCGRESATPDKQCPIGMTETLSSHLNVTPFPPTKEAPDD
jgi:hypothetical protein